MPFVSRRDDRACYGRRDCELGEKVTASKAAVQRIRKTTKKQPYESRAMPLGFDEVLAILEEDPKRAHVRELARALARGS